MMEQWGHFTLTVDSDGVAVALFSRPPVNAVSIAVYEDLVRLADRIDGDPAIKAVVLTAPDESRAWCGGADLNDFVGMDPVKRKARYEFINASLPRFAAIERPVIAAINGPVVGIGMLLVGLCDMRVAAENARFSCPEIDYGLVAGGAGILALARMPEAKVREMLFTGSRFTARELEPTGYFNYVVPREDVLAKAMDLAKTIAGKSLPAIVARKQACLATEGRTWTDAYLQAQALSGGLAAGRDGAEGVAAFLEKRPARFGDA
ncbi:enoyl-CoA hydratase/isomerase family protein [Novosphingobium piscinae]|uniref:Enoyl-CoA hydratase/isomerase family protein n=1 Tax=Novosphingobium piscinae TaxID=1507448 RepID=A0A7X1KRB6_9SPHN|nr:enoyl-CoA hydratase/isomerase family protein [Novosphingobium piscinae]MBC2670572.1 enoyl-CoA hydratase/isomerase family protein [Novosphingobium piscinae]